MATNYSERHRVTAASRCLLWLIRRPLILRGREGILVLMWNYWANILPALLNTVPNISINIFRHFSRYSLMSFRSPFTANNRDPLDLFVVGIQFDIFATEPGIISRLRMGNFDAVATACLAIRLSQLNVWTTRIILIIPVTKAFLPSVVSILNDAFRIYIGNTFFDDLISIVKVDLVS